MSPNNSNSVSQLTPNVDATYDVRKAEVTFRNALRPTAGRQGGERSGRYRRIRSVACGRPDHVCRCRGHRRRRPFHRRRGLHQSRVGRNPDFLAVNAAFFDFDPGNLAGSGMTRHVWPRPRFGVLRTRRPMGGGREPRWRLRRLERLDVRRINRACCRLALQSGRGRSDYAYAGSASILHDPTGLSLTLSTGGQNLDQGDDAYKLYGKIGYDTEIWAIGPTGFGIDYTQGKNISGEGDEGTSYGIRPCSGSSAMGSISTPSSLLLP